VTFSPIEQEQLARCEGTRWVLFGDSIDARANKVVRN